MKKRIYMVLLVVCLSFLLQDILDRPREYNNVQLEQQFRNAKDGANLNMESLTDFEWDGLYVLGPYSNPRSLDITRINKVPDAISYSDQYSMLVFVKGNKAIKYMFVPRDAANFAVDAKEQIRSSNAVFIKDADKNMFVLENGKMTREFSCEEGRPCFMLMRELL